MLLVAATLSILGSVFAQDQNAPAQFVGTWVGTRKQVFAQVDPTVNPDALECETTTLSSPSQTITIGTKNVAFSAYGATITGGLGMAAFQGLTGTWAAFTGSTASVRDALFPAGAQPGGLPPRKPSPHRPRNCRSELPRTVARAPCWSATPCK